MLLIIPDSAFDFLFLLFFTLTLPLRKSIWFLRSALWISALLVLEMNWEQDKEHNKILPALFKHDSDQIYPRGVNRKMQATGSNFRFTQTGVFVFRNDMWAARFLWCWGDFKLFFFKCLTIQSSSLLCLELWETDSIYQLWALGGV